MSNIYLNKLNYVCDHILKPWSKQYTSNEKKVSWATTLILGTFTIGAVQLGALLAKGIVHLSKKGSKKHSSSNKTQSVANTVIPPSVSSLKKDKIQLTKKIKKNLALEKKLSKEISNLRKKIAKAPVIDEAQVQIVLNKRKQLRRLISKTEKLEKKKNNILLQLNLPEENNIHPKAKVDFPNLQKKFQKLAEEILVMQQKVSTKNKVRMLQNLQLLTSSASYDNFIKDIAKIETLSKEDNDKAAIQTEIACIKLEHIIPKLIKIKESGS